jgi:predicted membrane protein
MLFVLFLVYSDVQHILCCVCFFLILFVFVLFPVYSDVQHILCCVCFFILFVFVLFLVYSDIQHILCCVCFFYFVCIRLVSCEYKQNKKKHTTQYVLDIIIHKKQDEYKQNKKNTHNTICVGYHYTQETRQKKTKLKKHTKHKM